jgi:hypothetical protein
MARVSLNIFIDVYRFDIRLVLAFIFPLILIYIYGYFWLRKHNRKEREKRNLENDLNKIGKE